MWAVIEFTSKQFLVAQGDKITVDNFDFGVGDNLVFDKILLVSNGELSLGKPLLKNFKVEGRVLRKFLGPKVKVIKFKAKSRYLKKAGFRPKLAEIEIEKIKVSKN